MIRGIHTPIISELLFYQVQDIINTKKRTTYKSEDSNTMFFLKGYLICPICGNRIRGSFSQGKAKRYPYYHCHSRCKLRIGARLLNDSYCKQIQEVKLSKKVFELFKLILEDVNMDKQKLEYFEKYKLLCKHIERQDTMISRARNLFVSGKLNFDDFVALKKEYLSAMESLKKELVSLKLKIDSFDSNFEFKNSRHDSIFENFEFLETADKKLIIDLFRPIKVNFQTGELHIEINSTISKVLEGVPRFLIKENQPIKFQDKKISSTRAKNMLEQNKLSVNENEAKEILNFLYLIARNHKVS
jgi:site-specific DNA recombinase